MWILAFYRFLTRIWRQMWRHVEKTMANQNEPNGYSFPMEGVVVDGQEAETFEVEVDPVVYESDDGGFSGDDEEEEDVVDEHKVAKDAHEAFRHSTCFVCATTSKVRLYSSGSFWFQMIS